VGGVRAWALRVRSNALWADGVNATGFTIPPRVVPARSRAASPSSSSAS